MKGELRDTKRKKERARKRNRSKGKGKTGDPVSEGKTNLIWHRMMGEIWRNMQRI